MSAPLPLAAAQARLGRPGRPRKHPKSDKDGDNRAPLKVEAPQSRGVAERRASAFEASVPAPALLPRLLTIPAASAYLSLSEDVVLELMEAGTFTRITIPAPVTAKRKGGAIRRVLLDRLQLDAAVAGWTRASEVPR